jgi:hypothetical protein
MIFQSAKTVALRTAMLIAGSLAVLHFASAEDLPDMRPALIGSGKDALVRVTLRYCFIAPSARMVTRIFVERTACRLAERS